MAAEKYKTKALPLKHRPCEEGQTVEGRGPQDRQELYPGVRGNQGHTAREGREESVTVACGKVRR